MQAPHLTQQEMQEIEQLLGTLFVPLEESKTIQGLSYIRERLTLCRAMLDQIHDIRLRVVLASSRVQAQLIFAKHSQVNADSPQAVKQWKQKVMELQQAVLSHKALTSLVTATNSMLLQTQRDIRQLMEIMKEQIKLAETGGVDPHEAEEALIEQVDLASMGKPVEHPPIDLGQFMEPEPEAVPEDQIPEQPVGDDEDEDAAVPEVVPEVVLEVFGHYVPQPPPAQGDEFADLFTGVTTQPAAVTQPLPTLPVTPTMQTVGFGDAVVGTLVETLPRGMPVPDLSSVPIESLFEEDTHGNPTPVHRVF